MTCGRVLAIFFQKEKGVGVPLHFEIIVRKKTFFIGRGEGGSIWFILIPTILFTL